MWVGAKHKREKGETGARKRLRKKCPNNLAHCCTIFLKSSGYQNIDDRHRNPNIHIREIIWLGNQLHRYTDTQILIRRYSFTDTDTQIQKYTDIYTWFLSDLRKFKKSICFGKPDCRCTASSIWKLEIHLWWIDTTMQCIAT